MFELCVNIVGNKKNYIYMELLLTCTKMETSVGNIERGLRKILKSDKATKAVFASRTFFSSIKT